jgi:aminoglycoside/choline kinase family phosphotransferase
LVTWPSAQREALFEAWWRQLPADLGLQPDSLRPASADASFRRYLRVDGAGGSWIIMDAPPPHEDVRPFVDVAARLAAAGLSVPAIAAQDVSNGFLLLQDLGNEPYLPLLQAANAEEADHLMRPVLDALVQMQQRTDVAGLPLYDEALLHRELNLFADWCVAREHGIDWSATQRLQWDTLCRLLVDSALAQPRVFVHRDWMARNLMRTPGGLGVLDFQDAVHGPLTYDIASLLRDAFWSWDEAQEIDWAVRWWQAARRAGLPVPDDFGECWRQIEWMGLQRHLKVAGIFCRLKHRDGKPRYAEDLPRFLGYMTRVAMRYRPLQGLLPLIEPLGGSAVRSGYTF